MKYTYSVILYLSLLLGLNACTSPKGEIAPSTKRPNIFLFLADDMTWRDCQPYGNEDVYTPHLQKLAKEGVCFDNMFTSTAMCAPTRQQLFTGLFPVRNGAYPNHSQVHEGVKSLGHYFRDLGYQVVLIGKRHYGPSSSFPFKYLGGRDGDNGKNGPDIDLSLLDSSIQSDQPFFIIVAQNQPHLPWNRGDASKYHPDSLSIPEYMLDTEFTRQELTKYYAEITHMDSLLGVCLDKIEVSGKTQNTISIFTSEQGSTRPFAKWTCYDRGLKTGFIAKWPGHIAEGSRNNALTQYVDVVPSLLEAVGANVKQLDPGIADANGNRALDGRSFLNVLKGDTAAHRGMVFGVHTTRGINNGSLSYPVRSVRNHHYKYIRNLSPEATFYNNENTLSNKHFPNWIANTKSQSQKAWLLKYQNRPYEELYDIKNDPWEMTNLADQVDLQGIKEELAEALDTWMQQQGDQGAPTELSALDRMADWAKGKWKPYQK